MKLVHISAYFDTFRHTMTLNKTSSSIHNQQSNTYQFYPLQYFHFYQLFPLTTTSISIITTTIFADLYHSPSHLHYHLQHCHPTTIPLPSLSTHYHYLHPITPSLPTTTNTRFFPFTSSLLLNLF